MTTVPSFLSVYLGWQSPSGLAAKTVPHVSVKRTGIRIFISTAPVASIEVEDFTLIQWLSASRSEQSKSALGQRIRSILDRVPRSPLRSLSASTSRISARSRNSCASRTQPSFGEASQSPNWLPVFAGLDKTAHSAPRYQGGSLSYFNVPPDEAEKIVGGIVKRVRPWFRTSMVS